MIKEQITKVIETKLAIYPKENGLLEDIFDCDGKVQLIRLFYHNEYHRFNFIKIGDKTFDYTPSTAPPSKIEDFVVDYEFKNGDKFVIESNYKIEKIELFI